MGRTKKKHTKKVVHEEKPDAFDIASQKSQEHDRAEAPDVAPLAEDDDKEEMTDQETDAIVERAQTRKELEQEKLESTVDGQHWSISDPVIPEELKGRVWVAVFKCPEGHKTKATNRQAASGVLCCKCREAGKSEKAEIMPQFRDQPEPPEDEVEKRKKARKGAE